jgi:hypothetical protein
MAFLLALVAGAGTRPAAAQDAPRFLAKEDILLYGLGLKVEPSQQTVPKDIATIVSTYLQAPQLPTGVPGFAPDAQVFATLRGPSFQQPVELHAAPNTPFNIPPLNIAGTYTLDSIRLVSNGEVLLRGSPESVRIDVIDKLLVTQVTARALTAQEIREKGIVFDKSNFQAYNFAAAFAIQDNPININFTVVLPSVQGAADVSLSTAVAPIVPSPSLPSLRTIIPDTLKLQTQIPNLQVVGFTLKIPQLKGQDFVVPPIPGVIVIPGDIGFLNQYFSVMLMVSNAAPGGSHLIVTDLTAEVVLPPGRDGVVGTPDDPLAMARLATGESLRIAPIVQLGADGQRGTADDIHELGPQENGSAEYLVEGRREGSHVVEMQITGTLTGLPIGPVTVTGRAAGSVLVRNPKFTLTFTHPQVVDAGEAYTLDVTVTNTSESPANFVSVSLHGQNISGATIIGETTKSIESVAPGDSQMISFDLISKLTGSVTAATLDADDNVAGRFELKTSVGELGIPLSPDSLVLPPEANGLPKELRAAAIGLLAKAYAVATAPPAALPKDIQRFSRQIVIDSAVSLAEAGLRITLHEPVPDSAIQLAMDFAGSDYARLPALHPQPADLDFTQTDRTAFDALRRKTVRGDVFAQAVASILAGQFSALGPAAFHQQIAEKISYRPGHISVLVGGSGPLPFSLALIDAAGRRVGGVDATGKVQKQVPFSDFMTFASGGTATGAMALITTPDPGDYVIRLDPIAGVTPAPVTLSLVYPAADGTLRQIVFDGVVAGMLPSPSFTAADPVRFTVQLGGADPGTPLTASTAAAIVEPPPGILGIVQQISADQLRCDASEEMGVPVGRVIAVLFSKEVTAASAQDKAQPGEISNYTSDSNRVVGAALQPGRRIVYLALRDPVGQLVPANLTISGVSDEHGHAMPAETRPIETTMEAGGVISGRVLQADGTPVANADLRLFYLLTCEEPRWVGISQKPADDTGHYSWNFVGNTLPQRIVAVDPATDEFRDVRFNIQRNGQRMTVDLVLLGRGTVQGRTLAQDGTPLRDSVIRITSLTDQSQYGAKTDVDGKFAISRIPVGSILIEAVNTEAHAKTFISQAIPAAGATTMADLILLTVDMTPITLKMGTVTGHTFKADGVTPIAQAPVIAWYQSGSQAGIPCPGDPPPGECAVGVVNSDPSGAYAFSAVIAGALRLQTFDQNSLSQGQVRVILAADGAVDANILLSGGFGTVRGTVLDPAGQPVVGARVGGGLSLTTTDVGGQFVLTDVPTGRRSIVAVSDTLGSRGSVTIDLVREGDEVGATIVLESVAGVAGTVFEADSVTPAAGIRTYLVKKDEDGQLRVVGSAVTDAGGHYQITKVAIGDYQVSAFRADFSDGNIRPVPLKFFNQLYRADVVFRGGGGKVTGVALDSDGHTPLKAGVSVSGDQLVVAGGLVGVAFQYVQHYKITSTDFTTGRYAFSGLWVGKVTITAAGQFSPDPVALSTTIPAPNATVQLDIRLKATSSLAGVVLQPDGATPVGANLIVKFKSDEMRVICSEDAFGEEECKAIPQGIQEENVVTDPNGHFLVPVVNAGVYTITVEDPVTGRIGIGHGSVRAGDEGHITVRLLGLGEVTVNVRGSDGTTPIPNAKVTLTQSDYPNKTLVFNAGANGTVIFSGGDALTEGAFAVAATDQRNGFTGRASGKVTRDGDHVTVNLYLYDAWGFVTGHVLRSDHLTPVPTADVIISNAAGPLAFSLTDADGAYEVNYIPIGPVTVEIFDAATARRGFGSGRVDFPQQRVPVDIVENALGLVKGVVLEGGPLMPLVGWEVTLDQTLPSGRSLPSLKTTSSIDGSYSFPGASQGMLGLRAERDGVNGSASATTSITREAQVVEVPLVATIIRPLAGTVTGIVYNSNGSPGVNALVDVCPGADCIAAMSVTAGGDGTFLVDQVRLGRFLVRAHSQVTQDAGSVIGELRFNGQVAGVSVAMSGLSAVTGTVYNADGSVAGGARLELTGVPSSGCSGPCVQFALPNGTFTFPNVAAASFTLVATGAVSDARGVVGDRLTPGQTKTVSITLAPFGQLSGRVLFPGGAPAANIVEELVIGGRHLFVQSAADGTYAFAATPVGAYTLTLQDPIGPGLAYRSGTIIGPTTLADVQLDTGPPAVSSVSPAPSASGVARDAKVQIVFSEPIDVGTATQANVSLGDGAANVVGTIQAGSGDTTITFTPLAALKDETQYTIRVANIKDRVGNMLPSAYVTSFTTVDIKPPRTISISPAPATSGVAIDSPVRIQFSEKIDPVRFTGVPIVVSGAAGAIAGRIDYLFGNTVVVFTPNVPLADTASYRVDRLPATDLSGNIEPAPASYSFATTDRTPPVLAGLTAPPTVIENTPATVTASLGPSSDVAVVDFYINDVFSFAARSAPFAMTFQATPTYGKPGVQIRLSALATDTSGNRAVTAATTTITVTPDMPPVIQLAVTTPTGQLTARNNDRVVVTAHASDDIGVAQLGYKANTGNPLDAAISNASPAIADRIATFAFHVPADATPGSTVRVQASASDTKGQITQAATIDILVLDAIPPVVTITGATTGARVNPGEQTTVAVSVQDTGGIASITLTATGVTQFTQTRAVTPSQPSAITSFTFGIPATARATDSITLIATALDQAGNLGTSGNVVLPVSDGTPPTITLQTANGLTDVGAGQEVVVTARADDDIAVTRIDLTGSGAVSVSQSRAFSPALGSASADFRFTVPVAVPEGAAVTLQARAADLSGNVSPPASLVLTVHAVQNVLLPPSVLLKAGESATVTVQIPDGAASDVRIDLASDATDVASVTPSVTFAAGDTSKTFTIAGQSGGAAQITASIRGVARTTMTAAIIGGIVTGIVTDDHLQPVAGADVTVGSGFNQSAVTAADGSFAVEGATGPYVSVRATDPSTHLYGFASGLMNRAGGFARINVVMMTAASVSGTVFQSNGVTPAGENVRVDIYDTNDASAPRATTFSDASSGYEFPFVQLGQYRIDATGATGERARATVRLATSAESVILPLSFLGQGTVTGRVLDGFGNVVNTAAVALHAYSVFGGAPDVQVTTGNYRFDGVLIGQFWIEARDPASGQAGSVSGSVARAGDSVAADVHLSTFGTVKGTVYRADRQTTVAGANVHANGRATTTNELGEYEFDIMPLGPVYLTVDDPGARGKGVASTTLSAAGQTQNADVYLFDQGSLIVTVLDANLAVVPNANVYINVTNGAASDSVYARAGANGVAVIDHILAGTFSVSADNGVLRGLVSGRTLSANEIQPLTVRLQATGSIAGLVLDADGQTPVSGGRVDYDLGSVPVGDDGTYHIDLVPLGNHGLSVYDATGRIRAFTKAPVLLTRNGQVATRNFTFVGIGRVVGQVKFAATGDTAPDFGVTVQSLNADFGGVRQGTTNAAGFYQIDDVPVGPFGVSTGDLSRQLWGEGAGTLARDGDTAEVNVLLESNAITLPTIRYDANNFVYDVQPDGTIAHGSSPFNSAFKLDVIVNGAASRFAGGSIPTVEQSGREIVTRQNGLAGLNVTRKLFVPATGYFSRQLEVLSNPTLDPITVDVRVTSGMLGGLNVVGTSSGDSFLSLADPATADRWVVVDDLSDGDPALIGGQPATAFAFTGAGAAAPAGLASYTLSNPAQLQVGWNHVVVPPGGTVSLLHFAAQQTSRAAAAASVDRLSQLPPEALEGLTADEIAAIVNFAVPQDGRSLVAALPPLSGAITGRVFEGDSSSPTASAQVALLSGNLFYGRTHRVSTDATGAFTFDARFAEGNSRPVPIDTFTLQALHPTTGVASPLVAGAFDAGAALASRDIIFNNTSVLTGTIRRHTGAAVTSGSVRASRVAPPLNTNTSINGDATYRLTGLPPGTYALTASVPHPQGTALVGAASVAVIAGSAATADITIQATGAVSGTVTTASGAPVASARVDLYGSGFSRSTNTDTGGAFSLPDVPEGTFTAQATNPVTGLPVSVAVTVQRDQTSPANLRFPPVGRLEVQVNFAGGAPAPNAPVFLQEAVRGSGFRYIGATDGAGHLTLAGLSAGAFDARAQHPHNSRLLVNSGGTLADDGSAVPVALTLPIAATVTGTVTDQSGAAVANIGVTIRSTNAQFGGFQSASTDSNGVYRVPGVPVGTFTATVQDFVRQLFGETSGEVVADGDLTLNISLINNAISLPADLYDANNNWFRIESNGRISGATNTAFGYGYYGSYYADQGASQLEIVGGGSSTPFAGANVGTTEQNGREIVQRQSNVAGLDIQRKVFVPAGGYFARHLELLTNPTNAPITADVRVHSTLLGNYYGPLSITTTSTGDAALDVGNATNPDRWVTFDDAQDGDPFQSGGQVPSAFVFDGPGAAIGVASAALTGGPNYLQTLAYEWRNVTVPAGQTVAVMHFVVQGTSRAGAAEAARRLSQIPPEALDGLSPEEIAAVQNFALPASGLSTVVPLPALTGVVSGRVLGGDGTTTIPGAAVLFKSANPLFGRTWQATANSSGVFTLAGHIDTTGNGSVPVPVGPFTLHTQHPQTSVQVDQAGGFTGDFTGNLAPLGHATASSYLYQEYGSYYATYYGPQNAIDPDPSSQWIAGESIVYGSNAPWLDVSFPADVTVSHLTLNTSYLQTALVELIDAAGQVIASADYVDTSSGVTDIDIAGTGVRRVRITDEADYSYVYVRDLQIIGSIPASAGAASQNVVFANTGTVAVTVRRQNGTPATSGSIQLIGSYPSYINVYANLNAGSYTFTGVPAGVYTLTASVGQPQGTALNGSATVTVVNGATVAVDVPLEATGTVTGAVHRGSGALSSGSYVQLLRSYPYFVRSTYTDGNGQFLFSDVPLGDFVLRANEPNTGHPTDAPVTVGAADVAITQDITLIGIGTARVHVAYGSGVPAVSSLVYIRQPVLGYYFEWGGYTDGNGDLTINNVVQGGFTIRAFYPQNTNLYTDVDATLVNDGDSPLVVATLPATGAVSGAVTNADGSAVPYPNVVLRFPNGTQWGPTTTDASGHFTFNSAPVGQDLTVRAFPPYPKNWAYGETPFRLTQDSESQTVNVRLPGFAQIRVHVVQNDGVTPLRDAQIYSKDQFRTYLQYRGPVNGNGDLTLPIYYYSPSSGFEQFAEGTYTIQVNDPNTGRPLAVYQGTIAFADINTTVNLTINAGSVRGNITGHVYAADGATPVPGSLVYVLNPIDGSYITYQYADDDGSFSFSNLLVGPQGFIMRAYSPWNYSLIVERTGTFASNGDTRTVDVLLPLKVGTITGAIVGADGTTPLPGIRVVVQHPSSGYTLANTTTDAAGRYQVAGVFADSSGFNVIAMSQTLSIQQTGAFATFGETVTINFTLPLSSATVSGAVFAGDGATPVYNARVRLRDSNGNQIAFVRTDSSGAYSFGAQTLDQNGFTVRADYSVGEGGISADVTAPTPPAGANATVNVTLPMSVIRGNVTFSDGTAVANPSVFAVDASHQVYHAQIVDAAGHYAVFGAPIGTVAVTAQDSISSLSTTVTGELTGVAVPLVLDVALPLSGAVTGRLTDAAGAPVAGVAVALGSPTNSFVASVTTDQNGMFTFAVVAVGTTTVQARFYDGIATRYVSASGTVQADQTLTLNLAWDGGGTVTGAITTAAGTTPANVYVTITAFGGSGPFGAYSNSQTVTNGVYQFTDVPAGDVHVDVLDNGSPALGGANGTVAAGATLFLDVQFGNLARLGANLIGADGFRYDVQNGGELADGGTMDGRLNDAYDGADYLTVNNASFPSFNTATLEADMRQLAVGPAAMGGLHVTRKIFVPAVGGFARYLEILSNPGTVTLTATVVVDGNLGSDSRTRVVVGLSTTGNTFAVTDQSGFCCDPALGHVFQGAGTPLVTVSAIQVGPSGNDNFSATYQVSIAPGATVAIMHFEVQRELTDLAGAEAGARGLVGLTNAHALEGMSEDEKNAVVNFTSVR